MVTGLLNLLNGFGHFFGVVLVAFVLPAVRLAPFPGIARSQLLAKVLAQEWVTIERVGGVSRLVSCGEKAQLAQIAHGKLPVSARQLL